MGRQAQSRGGEGVLRRLRGVEVHDVVKKLHSVGFRALERVSAHDGAVAATLGDLADLFEDGLGALGGPAREDD